MTAKQFDDLLAGNELILDRLGVVETLLNALARGLVTGAAIAPCPAPAPLVVKEPRKPPHHLWPEIKAAMADGEVYTVNEVWKKLRLVDGELTQTYINSKMSYMAQARVLVRERHGYYRLTATTSNIAEMF